MSLVLEVYDHLFVCSFLSCYFLLVHLLATISVPPCRRCLLHFSLKHDKDYYLTRFSIPLPFDVFFLDTLCRVSIHTFLSVAILRQLDAGYTYAFDFPVFLFPHVQSRFYVTLLALEMLLFCVFVGGRCFSLSLKTQPN